jgi:hypothetical protein
VAASREEDQPGVRHPGAHHQRGLSVWYIGLLSLVLGGCRYSCA